MPLPALLRAEISRRGPIPFRDFMEHALYHPEHGYYTSGRAAIGRGGDFFTSVSVGSLFGRLLACQFEEMWQRLDCPGDFTIVEQGAHDGRFASDVLSHLHLHSPAFHESLRYTIIEPSARARATQHERLGSFAESVTWVASPADLAPFTGVHFSNELLDAFPVHLLTWTGTEWLERHVTAEGDAFVFTDAPLSSPALCEHLARLPAVPAGYVTEVNLAALTWLAQLAPKLQRGLILAIDYGYARADYYREDRTEGTLSAYADHRRERNPLARPGEIDLTAHVDFTTLAEHALALGFALTGFTDQHHLMVGLSPLHFPDEPAITLARQKDLRALQTLMHPTMLGRAFQAICLSWAVPSGATLAGFRFANDPRLALDIPR